MSAYQNLSQLSDEESFNRRRIHRNPIVFRTPPSNRTPETPISRKFTSRNLRQQKEGNFKVGETSRGQIEEESDGSYEEDGWICVDGILISKNFTSGNPGQQKGGSFKVGETSRGRIDEESDGSDGEDDWMCRDDEYDSDDLSSETAKKSKWLRDFFKWFESLTDEEIHDPMIKMHCPACKNGVGAIGWYTGFRRVITHAENVRKRIRLHRKFAELLDGEMRNRSMRSLGPRQEEEVLQWKGLEEKEDDQMIVWPPMVLVQNTRSHKDESGKWVGMKKPDLVSCFKQYDIKNVKNAYGPAGHCGLSLLIFDDSAAGYVEAESLHKQFLRESRGKCDWESRGRTHTSGERLLYGYMATEGDMEFFNRHSKGKQKHKYEMKSYKTMVVNPLKKMNDKDEGGAEQNKSLAETYESIAQKLRLREIEIKTIRERAVEEITKSREEIDYVEQYYSDNIRQLSDELEKIKMERGEIHQSFQTPPDCLKESPSVA